MRWLLFTLLLCVSVCSAGEIVVLSKTPVAEFVLPDGSVLKNAYAWKRSSAGIMIIHDGGSHFLNFDILPFDWKKAYGLVPADAVDPAGVVKKGEPESYEGLDGVYMSPEEAEEYKKQQEIKFDPNYVSETLRQIDLLPRRSIRHFASSDYKGDVDEALFTACVCQNLLNDNLPEGARFYKKLKEQFPDSLLDINALYLTCEKCSGKKVITSECRACDGTGTCPKCEGTGEVATGLSNEKLPCPLCRGTGKCLACGGDGELERQCLVCKGQGRIFQRALCEESLKTAVETLINYYNALKQDKV